MLNEKIQPEEGKQEDSKEERIISSPRPVPQPEPAPENVHQPGIIFSNLGSKISSEELLKRFEQEGGNSNGR
jgi:hypothetical protein